MPSVDTSIITGKSSDIGLAAIPDVNIRATIPTIAATMTSGSSLVIRLPGVVRGISGGVADSPRPRCARRLPTRLAHETYSAHASTPRSLRIPRPARRFHRTG